MLLPKCLQEVVHCLLGLTMLVLLPKEQQDFSPAFSLPLSPTAHAREIEHPASQHPKTQANNNVLVIALSNQSLPYPVSLF